MVGGGAERAAVLQPVEPRVRRRRHRMTRSGRAERLQREIAARDGIETAECVRSRTASAAALQRRARARLSVAVALLWPQEKSGWGLPLTVVARILDFIPIRGDAAVLREAAAAGDLPRVRKHLELGVDPNAADPGVDGIVGATALHWAASGGHAATVVALLNAKADPRLACAGMSGSTALHIAAAWRESSSSSLPSTHEHAVDRYSAEANRGQWRRRQMIEALLLAGADPSLTTMGAGSLRRAQRRLCVCFALVAWSNDMTAMANRRPGRLGGAHSMSKCGEWFNVVMQTIVNNLPIREQTPIEKALEYGSSISIFSQWERAAATANSLSPPAHRYMEIERMNERVSKIHGEMAELKQRLEAAESTVEEEEIIRTRLAVIETERSELDARRKSLVKQQEHTTAASRQTRLEMQVSAFEAQLTALDEEEGEVRRKLTLGDLSVDEDARTHARLTKIVQKRERLQTRLQIKQERLRHHCDSCTPNTPNHSGDDMDVAESLQQKSEKNAMQNKRSMLDIASLVERNAHTTSIYNAYTDTTVEDEKRSVLKEVNMRLQEIYRCEYRAKEAIRNRFRRAVRPHLPPPKPKETDTDSGISLQERSRIWIHTHSKLLVHTHSYPGLDELQRWATQNGLNANDRLNLLESCW